MQIDYILYEISCSSEFILLQIYINVRKLLQNILNICSDWHLSDLYLDESIEKASLVVTAFQNEDLFKCTLTWTSDNAIKIYSSHEYEIHFGKLKTIAIFKIHQMCEWWKRLTKYIWRAKGLQSIKKFEMPLQFFLYIISN